MSLVISKPATPKSIRLLIHLVKATCLVILFLVFGVGSEYTCDRCGLILTKDIDSAISAIIKLSLGGQLFKKFNIDGYIPQLKKSESKLVKSSEMLISHPTIANRVKAVINYWKINFN